MEYETKRYAVLRVRCGLKLGTQWLRNRRVHESRNACLILSQSSLLSENKFQKKKIIIKGSNKLCNFFSPKKDN